MKSLPRYILPLIILSFLATEVRAEKSKQAAEKDKSEQTKTLSSLLGYRPSPSDYDPALKGIVKTISQAVGKSRADKPLKDPSQRKKLEQALGELQRLRGKLTRGHFPDVDFLRAYAWEKLGENEKALALFNATLEQKSFNTLARFHQAWLLKNLNRCPEAVKGFQEVEWQMPNVAHEALFGKAECLALQGKEAEAVLAFETAYRRKPDFPPAVRRFVEIRQRKLPLATNPQEKSTLEGELIGALSTLRNLEPEDRSVALSLGQFLLKNGDPLGSPGRLDQAKSLAAAAAKKSNFSDDEFVRLLFDVQLKQQDFEAARKTLVAGLKAKPKSALLADAKRQFLLEAQLRGSPTTL